MAMYVRSKTWKYLVYLFADIILRFLHVLPALALVKKR